MIPGDEGAEVEDHDLAGLVEEPLEVAPVFVEHGDGSRPVLGVGKPVNDLDADRLCAGAPPEEPHRRGREGSSGTRRQLPSRLSAPHREQWCPSTSVIGHPLSFHAHPC